MKEFAYIPLGAAAFAILFTLIFGCSKQETAKSEHEVAMEASDKADADLRASFGRDADKLLFRQGVQHAIAKAGVRDLLHAHISHDVYQPVEKSWVDGAYSVELNRIIFDSGAAWRGGALNCEDFSLGATFVAKAAHLSAPGRIRDASPAFGFLYYKPEDPAANKMAHAINFGILSDGSLIFYEPQSRQRVRLSDAEVASIYFWEL